MQRTEGHAGELARSLELVEAEVWSDWLAAAPPHVAEQLGVRQIRVGSAVAGVAPGTDVLMFNRAVGIGMDAGATHGQIDELLDVYERAGVARWMVQWCPSAQPASMPDLLRANGFYHHNNWMKLHRSASIPLPECATALRLEQVGGDGAGSFVAIMAAAYGFDSILAEWTAGLLDRPAWRTYMAFDGRRAVATGSLFVHGRTGWLGFAATHPDYRGRGAHSALTAVRIRAAAELGCDMVATETAEDSAARPAVSLRNMRRLGFEVAYSRPNYVMLAGARGTGIVAERTW